MQSLDGISGIVRSRRREAAVNEVDQIHKPLTFRAVCSGADRGGGVAGAEFADPDRNAGVAVAPVLPHGYEAWPGQTGLTCPRLMNAQWFTQMSARLLAEHPLT